MERDLFCVRKSLFVILCIALSACTSNNNPIKTFSSGNGSGTPTNTKIRVNWTANPEKDVNTTGGGYHVYYAKNSGVSTGSITFVDAPYVSGLTAPTTALLSGLTTGTYYVRVIAYSAYNPNAISGGNRSPDSSEMSVVVP